MVFGRRRLIRPENEINQTGEQIFHTEVIVARSERAEVKGERVFLCVFVSCE